MEPPGWPVQDKFARNLIHSIIVTFVSRLQRLSRAIEEGMMEAYIYDLDTGKKFGKCPNPDRS
jgi:hypothetical protein